MGVLVCGLQCSGNRLIQRLLEHNGQEALVWHGDSDHWKDWERGRHVGVPLWKRKGWPEDIVDGDEKYRG